MIRKTNKTHKDNVVAPVANNPPAPVQSDGIKKGSIEGTSAEFVDVTPLKTVVEVGATVASAFKNNPDVVS